MRWRILAVLALARVALGLQFQTVGSTGEYLRAEFALDYTGVGTLIGLFMLPGLVLAVPVGMAGRLVSDRLLTCGGFVLLGFGGVLGAIASSPEMVGTGRVICGAGFVLSTLYLAKMTTDWFSGREIATAMSILVMTWPLGIAIGQTAYEWLAAGSGWRSAFWVASTYAALAAVAILLLYREPAKQLSPATQAATGRLSRAEVWLTLVAASVWAFFNAGYVVFLSFAPLLLVDAGFSQISAAATISMASYLMLISGLGAGLVADRTGKPDWVMYGCTVIAIAALLMLGNAALAVFSSVLFGLIGVAPAGIIMALSAQAMRPENRALGMGLFFSVYFLMVAPSPAIAGWLYDWTGNPVHAIWFAATLFFVGMLANALFRREHRRMASSFTPGGSTLAGDA